MRSRAVAIAAAIRGGLTLDDVIGAALLVGLAGGLYVCEEHIRAVLWWGCP
jgi:hypothetical protein